MSQPTSFSVTIVNGDENFEFPFGSTVEDAFTTIHQCYPELKGRFCVISENGENMIDLKGVDSFPHDSEGKQVIFIPARLIALLSELPPKKLRKTRRLSLEDLIPLSHCSNLSVCNGSKYLVGVKEVIEKSLHAIKRQFEIRLDTSGSDRRSPLVFSAQAQGGKTTIVTRLFKALKEEGYLVMIISFNSGSGGFVPQPNETAESAILRQIFRALINQECCLTEDEYQEQKECFDEITLNQYLHEQTHMDSLSPKKFVMLIDGLDVLGSPLSLSASRLLQRLFLQVENRYLVFTTRVPLVLSEEVSSSMGIQVVQMPQSNNLNELRNMAGCRALTSHEAIIHGGIPGLIYSGMKNRTFPRQKFPRAIRRFWHLYPTISVNQPLRKLLLGYFLDELFRGRNDHGDPELRFFDQFGSFPESDKVFWPLCYISKVLTVFKPNEFGINAVIDEIYKICQRDNSVFASVDETGLDCWQSIVEVALLLRGISAILSKQHHHLLPFLLDITSITVITMSEEYRTLEQAHRFIEELSTKQPGHLYVIRSHYDKFPLFDGFLVVSQGIPNTKQVVGYQVKPDKDIPRYAVPNWVKKGIFIRGDAPSSSYGRPEGWTFMNERDIKDLLGYSLSRLYPASWVSEIYNRFD